MAITTVRGFKDVLPDEAALWKRIEDAAAECFASYGFSEIRVPIVERTELFTRSIGETTDIVEKEMYTFATRSGDSLTLRPEGTASVVRAYVEHKLFNSAPVTRLFYTGPMFRYERPQKGRQRQFYQIGAEVFGEAGAWMDAEVIEMLMTLFNGLGCEGLVLEINSLGCPECRPAYKDALKEYLCSRTENLCENCKRRIEQNPLRALDCKVAGCVEAVKDAPSILDSLCDGCNGHFETLRGYLDGYGIEAVINPRMVRGLDYYTRTTFEVTASVLGAQNAVAAGGRYDTLVSDLGGPRTPCVGFAIGMERLALVLDAEGAESAPLIYFISLGEASDKEAVRLIRTLRARGARVAADYSRAKLKSVMKRADRAGASFVMILGEDESAAGVVTVKDMKSGCQERLSPDKAFDKVGACRGLDGVKTVNNRR